MNNHSGNKQLQIRVCCALLIALEVILTKFLAIQTPALRISFSFVPLALAGMMFGPVNGLIVGAVGDLLGVILFPNGGFHPGFTLVAALTGMVYGLFLYQKPGTPSWSRKKFLLRVVLVVLLINVVFDMGLNTLWLTQLLNKGFIALLPARAVKQIAMIVVQIIMIPIVKETLARPLSNIVFGTRAKKTA